MGYMPPRARPSSLRAIPAPARIQTNTKCSRRRLRLKLNHMVVVGLSGPSAAGKSTLLSGLKKLAAVTVISCDDFYLPKDQCPRFSVAALPWPSGAVPAAFAERGDADMNVPGSVNWSGVLDAVSSAQSSEASNIVLDGLLLFGDHPGAKSALELCEHTACLRPSNSDADAMETLWRRKFKRSHLGKASYESRGVTPAEYAVYWDSYVWPRWMEHGEARIPEGTLRIDCLLPVEDQVTQLFATDWFAPLDPPKEEEEPRANVG